jgi:DNA polymerase elongation subunit (family B)
VAPKTLTIDIETQPLSGYFWGMFDQNIGVNQLTSPGGMICFGAKWLDGKNVLFHRGEDMLQAAWDLLDEADVVVSYNGDRFDVPHLNRAFAVANMPPPSPFTSVDLIRTVRRRFKFPSNKLDHVLDELSLPRKAETGGFQLWRDCMAGDEAAWRKMKRYNIQDVRATEALYTRLTPWLVGHAHQGLYEDGIEPVCSRCGSTNLMKHGFSYTAVSKFQRYRCNDCGACSRGGKAIARENVRGVA